MKRFTYSLVTEPLKDSALVKASQKNMCLNPKCSNKARTPTWGEDFVMRDEVREYMYTHCKTCLILILEGNLKPSSY